jgi:hypothetical protein
MYTEFPTLSLHEDNTMYLMISRHIGARNWWVIAVDTANMTLQDVAYYRPESRLIFRHSKISNHLNMDASPGNCHILFYQPAHMPSLHVYTILLGAHLMSQNMALLSPYCHRRGCS